MRMDVEFLDDVEDPIFSVSLQNESGHYVFVASTDSSQVATGQFAAGTTAAVRLRFDNHLAPGRYRLFATVARSGLGADVLDAHVQELAHRARHPSRRRDGGPAARVRDRSALRRNA